MLLGYKLNTVKKLDDYRKTVELFNKNNIIKIGDVVHIALKELTKPIEVVEVTLDLMLYGLLDDDSNLKYEFQPTFIIGGEPIIDDLNSLMLKSLSEIRKTSDSYGKVFDFVRMDYFFIDKPYLCEFTFSPSGGMLDIS